MPLRGSKKAPRTFTGKPHQVKEFLEDYEDILTQNNVREDKDKCKCIRKYCSRDVREILETLSDNNWRDLKKAIEMLFDADRHEKRYRTKDLKSFIKKSKTRPINSLAQYRHYFRDFQKIAGWLLLKNHITGTEYLKAFWKGIPRHLQVRLETEYYRQRPDHVISDPFEVEVLERAAQQMFGRSRFDADISDSEDGDDSDSDSSNSSSDIDSGKSDDESDYNYKHQARMQKTLRLARKRSKSRPSKPRVTFDDLPTPETKPRTETNDIENLINRLQNMSIDDPAYAALYYRAFKMDKDITFILTPPRNTGTRANTSA